jgi:hypothetical protein
MAASPLQRRFQTLERQKQATLAQLHRHSSEQLQLRPTPSAWSMIQIAEHLQRTEQAILSAAFSQPHAPLQTLPQRISAGLMIALSLSPARIRVPKAVSVIAPAESLTLPELEARWAATRSRLEAEIRTFPADKARCNVFRHPVSGWMTLLQTLHFLSAHLTHHGYQLRRVRRALQRYR